MATISINYIGYKENVCYAKGAGQRLSDCLLKKHKPYNHELVVVELDYVGVKYLLINEKYKHLVKHENAKVIYVHELRHMTPVGFDDDAIKINGRSLEVKIGGKGVATTMDAIYPKGSIDSPTGLIGFGRDAGERLAALIERNTHEKSVAARIHFR